MVMFWRSWAERLTDEEKRQIEEISHGWAYLNWDKVKRGWQGTFYYFPENSGYKDSAPIPPGIAEQHKFRYIALEHGWLDEKDRRFIDLMAVIAMFPEEIERIFDKYKAKYLTGTREDIT